MLSEDQKQEFKELGFLVIRDAIPQSVIEEANRVIWDAMPIEPGEFEKLNMAPPDVYDQMGEVESVDPLNKINSIIHEYAEGLIGEDVLEPPRDGSQIALRFPQDESPHHPDATQPSDLHGHIEGYGHNYNLGDEIQYGSLIGGTYLSRVRPLGGGFSVWPGSHWNASEYFESHSLESGRGGLPGFDSKTHEWNYEKKRSDQFDPFEVTGDAGTIFLSHYKLEHTGGVNLSNQVRMAVLTRFARTDRGGDKRDAATNIWKYWPAMEETKVDENMTSPRVADIDPDTTSTVDIVERRK